MRQTGSERKAAKQMRAKRGQFESLETNSLLRIRAQNEERIGCEGWGKVKWKGKERFEVTCYSVLVGGN